MEPDFLQDLELNEKEILLRKGKQERGKAQYYSVDPKLKELNSQKAAYFIENIVKPFVQIIGRML